MEFSCTATFAAILTNAAPGLCRAVDHYCERNSAAFDAELVNALTNLAFPFGAVLLWQSQAALPMVAGRTLIRALIIAMAVVGLGSLLFHVIGQRWAEWADVIPILVFILLYLWFLLGDLLHWPVAAETLFLAFFFAATIGIEAFAPGDLLWGGALFLPTILTFVAIGIALHRRHHPAGAAILAALAVFLAAFTFRSLDMPLCDRWPPGTYPLGTHFMWHLLNALLLFLLIRVAIRERSRTT
jgi:hypothetical protein